ncbi:MAG: hypothetical protein IKJ52_04065 [Muribaculaceae bacterium]|nr:hypothetical protein [Muribaculaceae bacterium]
MNISISYSEILNFVEKKFKVRPLLQKKTASALTIGYKPTALLPAMSVDIAVDGIDDDVVMLSYDCSKAISLVVSGVVTYLEEKMPAAVDVDTAARTIKLNLGKIDKLEAVLEYMALTDIAFAENEVVAKIQLL